VRLIVLDMNRDWMYEDFRRLCELQNANPNQASGL
jgi:hypothetical protein